jgi:hypothetical protein
VGERDVEVISGQQGDVWPQEQAGEERGEVGCSFCSQRVQGVNDDEFFF